MMNARNTRGSGFLRLSAALLLAVVLIIGMQPAEAAGAEIWVGSDTATTYATLADAMAQNPAPAQIRIKGNADERQMQAMLSAGYTLIVAGDVNATGSGGNGLVLKEGAKLMCENGAKLKMTGFKRALNAQAGSVIADGVYEFQGNSERTLLGGIVRGTADKTDVKITAKENADGGFYLSSSDYSNATITVDSQKRTWQDAADLKLDNVDLTESGFGMGNYVNNLVMKDSTWTINKGSSWRWPTGLTIQGKKATVENSVFRINVGSTAGLSVGGADVTLVNSALYFANNGTGGLNNHDGTITFQDSAIEGNGMNSGALFGIQNNKPDSRIAFKGSSLVETPAAKNADNGLDQLGEAYVVMGGSHRIFYSDSYYAGAAIPVNAPEHGSEKLSHFKLTSPAANELQPLDQNGAAYAYPVAKASSDGAKYVWVPGAKVTFKLNNPAAAFADGATANKEVLAMRGYRLADASVANGKPVNVPEAPSAIGWRFMGWGVGADGAETPFDPANARVEKDIEVKALWQADASSYGVIYHATRDEGSATFREMGNRPDRQMTAAAFADVKAANPAFEIPGTAFLTWEDENGNAVAEGSVFTVPVDTDVVHLYARRNDERLTVRFSANGGVFTESSVFKRFPQVFTIERDANGGEVARLNEKIAKGGKLDDALKAAGLADGASTMGIQAPDSTTTGLKTAAEKKYHKQAKREETVFIFTNTYYDWYSNPEGTGQYATVGPRTVINADTVYYLKWEPDETQIEQTVDQTNDLPADMWGAGLNQASSAKAPYVMVGQKVDMVGAISTKAIKEQMKNIEALFNENENFELIALTSPRSTFEAVLTMPAGVTVPTITKEQVQTDGFADTFTVTDVKTVGSTYTIKIELKGGITNYAQLKEAIDKLPEWMTLRVDGLTVAAAGADGKLTCVGDVKGDFTAVAAKGSKAVSFNLKWKGVQTPEGKDELAQAGQDDIRFTMRTVQPVALTIPGDMLVNDDTEAAAVYPVLPGDTVTLSGKIDIRPVRDQMTALENGYTASHTPFANIKVEGLAGGEITTEFIAKMTLPAGLSLPDTITPTHNFGSYFTVDKVETIGNTLTVEMHLKKGITNYQQLHDAVFNAGQDGWLKLDIPGVKVSAAAAPGSQLVARGTMTGRLEALASTPDKVSAFAYTWEAEQWPEGKDAAAGADTAIRVTMTPSATTSSELEGDILVNGDTEHDAVYSVRQGDRVTLTGALNMVPVKDQMRAIEGSIPPADFDRIAVTVRENRFTAVLTLPEDVSFPAGLNIAGVVPELGSHYKVDEVTVSGRTVTVVMVLKNNVTNYRQLREAVMGSPDWLKISIPGVTISSSAPVGKHLTVRGEVNCIFAATAKKGNTTRVYSFRWNGVQWPDGRDAAAKVTDRSVRLTMASAARPAATPAPKTPPKTGDAAAPVLWLTVALVSFAAAVLTLGLKKRSSK